MEEKGQKLPKTVETRIKRGRAHADKQRPQIKESYKFWQGDQYCHVSRRTGYVVDQQRVNGPGTGEDEHRVRQTRNLIQPIIEAKVSAASQRTPGYETAPSTTDPDDISASELGTKIALALWENRRVGIKRARVQTITNALVGGEGYAMPYFDPTVGPYVEVDGRQVGLGEVKIKRLKKDEVFSEPGCDFEDSRWFCIEQQRAPEDVTEMPRYIGPQELRPDAGDKQGEPNLVRVTEYFERPSPERTNGRKLVVVDERVVCEPEDYPCKGSDGKVLDQPILHKLSYTVDPDKKEDRGLVPHLIDAQRSYNDCNNKLLEWKNLCLFPQWLEIGNAFRSPPTDAPGARFKVTSFDQIKMVDTPQVPQDLYRMKDEAKGDMWAISWANEIPSQVESAKGIEAVLNSAAQSWGHFSANLAEFDAGVMGSCLYLAQRHYTEPRLMKFRGDLGWESIQDFQGAQLKDQIDVRVLPSSLTPRTKDAVRQEVMNIVQSFPGAISMEQAVRAIETGHAEQLIQGYENALARANRIIQKVKLGMEALAQIPPRPVFPGEPPAIDSATGLPVTEVPGWMPRPFDNVPVHKKVWEDWMTTPDYEDSAPEVQETANLVYSALLEIEQRNAMRQAELQTELAEQQGWQNAAKPQGSKPMPSLAKVNGTPT